MRAFRKSAGLEATLTPKIRLFRSGILVLFGLWILYGFGWDTVVRWLRTSMDGVVIASEDFPSTRHPRYASRYTVRDAEGKERIVWGTWADGTLPRSLPVGTSIRKKRWHFDYEQDGQTIRFSYGFYGISLSIAFGILIWGILSALPLLKSATLFRPKP